MPAGDPVYADEVEFSEQAPIGRCVASGTQALADNTQVAISFTTEEFDSHSQHSTSSNPSRVTPNVAGIYRFYGTFWVTTTTSPVSIDASFRVNGTTAISPGNRQTMPTIPNSVSVTALIACNGTTDYVELLGRQDSSVTPTTTHQNTQFSSVIEWKRERALIT